MLDGTGWTRHAGLVGRLRERERELAAVEVLLEDRGRIAEGYRADLVVIDPATYVDTATFDAPKQSPPGVVLVVVGGRVVFRDGTPTGARPGTITRSPR